MACDSDPSPAPQPPRAAIAAPVGVSSLDLGPLVATQGGPFLSGTGSQAGRAATGVGAGQGIRKGGLKLKDIEIPPDVAQRFVEDMRAFHAEKSPLKRDEIASRQIHVLRQYQGKSERPIKLHEVKQIFEEMRDDLA